MPYVTTSTTTTSTTRHQSIVLCEVCHNNKSIYMKHFSCGHSISVCLPCGNKQQIWPRDNRWDKKEYCKQCHRNKQIERICQ